MVKKSYHDTVSDVFKDFLSEGWTCSIGVNLRHRISDVSLLFKTSLLLDQLGCKCIYSLTIMIVAF